MTDSAGRTAAGIKPMPVPDITGNWMGMQHATRIEVTNSERNGLPYYIIGMIDTLHNRNSGSTWYEMDFIKAGGSPYAEVVSHGLNRDEHDFSPVVSTYARVNKLTRDSIIIQMMNSSFTQCWLKTKGLHSFITADENSINEASVYLTEDLPQLGKLLKKLFSLPKAFIEADTLVRLRMGF